MELEKGDLVQLSPDVGNPAFAYCFMIVTEPKSFGAMGYIQSLGTREGHGGQAYYRAKFSEMVKVGKSHWIVKQEE